MRDGVMHVRLILRATVDNPWSPVIYLDCVIDTDFMIVGRHTLFGLQGNYAMRERAYYPFTLDREGQIDFGCGYDGEANERHARCNIREVNVREGSLVELRSENHGVEWYRITEVLVVGQEARAQDAKAMEVR